MPMRLLVPPAVWLGAILVVVPLASCHRKRSGPQAKAEYLLTRRPWKYQRYVVDGRDIQPPRDRVQFLPGGRSLLSDRSNNTEGSRWRLLESKALIRFNEGTDSETSVSVVELTSTTLELKGLTTTSDGKEAPFDATLIH